MIVQKRRRSRIAMNEMRKIIHIHIDINNQWENNKCVINVQSLIFSLILSILLVKCDTNNYLCLTIVWHICINLFAFVISIWLNIHIFYKINHVRNKSTYLPIIPYIKCWLNYDKNHYINILKSLSDSKKSLCHLMFRKI